MTIGKNSKGEMVITLTKAETEKFDHPNRKRVSKTIGSANGEFRIDLKMTRTAPPDDDAKGHTESWRPSRPTA